MPRVSDHLVKSAIRLVRQSTTVPKTSNTSAFTAEISDMPPLPFFYFVIPGWSDGPARICSFHSLPGMTTANDTSIEVKFIKLPMFGLDVAHRAGDRAHHHRLGLDHVLAELD